MADHLLFADLIRFLDEIIIKLSNRANESNFELLDLALEIDDQDLSNCGPYIRGDILDIVCALCELTHDKDIFKLLYTIERLEYIKDKLEREI